MAKFNENTFNPEAFGKYVDRIPKTKRNELIKSRALKGNEHIRDAFSAQTGTAYATLPQPARIKMGILFPVLGVLMLMMVVDYITGMLASKVEAIDHLVDNNYWRTSKKGAKGIIKKVGYLCAIAVAMVVDFIIVRLSRELGYQMPVTVFFGLMVAVWYILDELLSIMENAGRMGANVPVWLSRYITVLKDKIDSNDYDQGGDKPANK